LTEGSPSDINQIKERRGWCGPAEKAAGTFWFRVAVITEDI
jgi:hypothetical protein